MWWWILAVVVSLVLLSVVWRDLTRKPDPMALPDQPWRAPNGENVSREHPWEGVRPPPGTHHQGMGPS